MAALTHLGFLHVVDGHEDPIGVVARALAGRSVADSLIVLPEAFNLGRWYRDAEIDGRFIPIRPFLTRLTALAESTGAAFVVGALEAVPGQPPYNAAFLVAPDANPPVLLSRKRNGDGRGFYQTAEGIVGKNPFFHGGVCIGTAICDDYQFLYPGRDLAERIAAQTAARVVLCIPAAMSDGTLTFCGSETAPWKGQYAVLANGHKNGCQSFLKNKQGQRTASYPAPGEQITNTLVLQAWSELDA